NPYSDGARQCGRQRTSDLRGQGKRGHNAEFITTTLGDKAAIHPPQASDRERSTSGTAAPEFNSCSVLGTRTMMLPSRSDASSRWPNKHGEVNTAQPGWGRSDHIRGGIMSNE